MTPPLLLAVPNVSEGRDADDDRRDRRGVRGSATGRRPAACACSTSTPTPTTTARSSRSPGARRAGGRAAAGAAVAVERIDVIARARGDADAEAGAASPRRRARRRADRLPRRARDRGAACAEALVLADRIGDELDVPVFLYGELTADGGAGRGRAPSCAAAASPGSRAGWRRGRAGRRSPRLRPAALHPSAGATLVAARAPLVAFNLQLARRRRSPTPARSRR